VKYQAISYNTFGMFNPLPGVVEILTFDKLFSIVGFGPKNFQINWF
jgi:hypothetical protein